MLMHTIRTDEQLIDPKRICKPWQTLRNPTESFKQPETSVNPNTKVDDTHSTDTYTQNTRTHVP